MFRAATCVAVLALMLHVDGSHDANTTQDYPQQILLKEVRAAPGRRAFLASENASLCIAGTFLAFSHKSSALYCAECGGGFFSKTAGTI